MLVVIPYPPPEATRASHERLAENPLSLFDIRGKVAIVTGASGAFGALAAKVLAGAGAHLVLAAGKATELDAIAKDCRGMGAQVER